MPEALRPAFGAQQLHEETRCTEGAEQALALFLKADAELEARSELARGRLAATGNRNDESTDQANRSGAACARLSHRHDERHAAGDADLTSGPFSRALRPTAAAFGALALIGSGSVAAPAPPAAEPAATRFVRDPARFKANEAKLVAATRQHSPAMAEALQRAFSQDVLAAIAPELRKLGLDDADMADMTAAYWVTAWEAAQGIIGQDSDPALVAGARRQIAGKLAGRAATMSDAIHAEAGQLLKTDLRSVRLTTAGFASTGGSAAGPTPLGPPAAPGTHAGNWQLVQGVYFKSYTTFGVGGMMIQDFEPVILFRDGRFYEVEGAALEDVDLAASQTARPSAWGKWRQQGDTFLLTDDRGRTHDYQLQQGTFFRAYPAEAAGGKLTRAYKRISGGGNSAIGGSMAIATQSSLAFTPDGRFSRGSSMGASGANVAAYSRKPGVAGRYRIERHTISFVDADGSTRREFFALGSEGSPPRMDSDLIFVGDRVFIKDD